MKKELRQEFKITHCTLQPEFELDDDKSLIVNGHVCSE